MTSTLTNHYIVVIISFLFLFRIVFCLLCSDLRLCQPNLLSCCSSMPVLQNSKNYFCLSSPGSVSHTHNNTLHFVTLLSLLIIEGFFSTATFALISHIRTSKVTVFPICYSLPFLSVTVMFSLLIILILKNIISVLTVTVVSV